MVKVMELVNCRPGMSRADFVKYYEEVHAPLALRLLPPFAKYARNYVAVSIEGQEPEFDCVTEMWYESPRAAQAVTDALGGSDATTGYQTEIGRIMRDDEERFMDRSQLVSFVVDERISRMVQPGA